jgi:predicted metal-dependent HD superfamily phosphohydrolase
MHLKNTARMISDETLEKCAAALYSDNLPYHNFSHALRSVEAGREIVARCMKEGVRIEADVVYYALLFHDAGYQDDHKSKGFESKEAYSAWLAAKALKQHGISQSTVRKVVDAIKATHRDAKFTTTEQKAVRAADLAELAADYDTFRANTENLKSEYEMQAGRTLTWEEWVDRAADVIRYFLAQEIRLTSQYANDKGESVFHKRVHHNLERLRQEKTVSP